MKPPLLRWQRLGRLTLCLPLCLPSCLPVLLPLCLVAPPAHAAWNAANDEANRQRAMQRMRDDSARADRAAADRAASQQRSAAAALERSRTSSISSNRSPTRNDSGRLPHFGSGDDSGTPKEYGNPNAITMAVPDGVPIDVALVMMEAKAGAVDSQLRLGRMLYAGFRVPRDDEQARRWIELAARKGSAEAQGLYGYFLERGLGGAASQTEAERWLLLAADHGDPFAQMRYGLLQLVKSEGRAGYDARPLLKYLVPSAEHGEWGSQAALASLYDGYLLVPANEKERVRWLQAAAAQGDPGSMKDLAGVLLTGGGGLRADPQASLQWLRKAVALQHPGATRNLAGYYFNGLAGLQPSASEGLALMKRAADLGDSLAQGQYGMVLIQGELVKPDVLAGVAYVRKSAEAENHFGLDALARLHVDGLGVERDLPRAVQLLRRSLQVGLETPDPDTTALLATPELQKAARQLDATSGK